jgi:hypothetical protein
MAWFWSEVEQLRLNDEKGAKKEPLEEETRQKEKTQAQSALRVSDAG